MRWCKGYSVAHGSRISRVQIAHKVDWLWKKPRPLRAPQVVRIGGIASLRLARFLSYALRNATALADHAPKVLNLSDDGQAAAPQPLKARSRSNLKEARVLSKRLQRACVACAAH